MNARVSWDKMSTLDDLKRKLSRTNAQAFEGLTFDHAPLAKELEILIQLLCVVFDRLGKLLIATPGYTYAEAWATALNRILTSSLLSEEKKISYWDLASDNRPLAALLSRSWRSNAAR
jgi:hypothetical protein